MIILWVILGVIVIVAFWIMAAYNGLVTLKIRAKEAWADIDVQLKRRYDLIPNLVETVKGYAAHESGVFENVTKARANALSAQQSGNPAEVTKAENALSGTLKTLFAVSENYPQLRASENFQKLQDELTDTEDKIQAARRFYNGNVRDLNTKIQTVPTNIIASMFNIKSMEFFELEEGAAAKEPVQVKF
jgi:LemA protein